MHHNLGQMWWGTSAVPELRRLGKEDRKFKVSLGYIATAYLKKQNENKQLPKPVI
jgi:hypothetical protein